MRHKLRPAGAALTCVLLTLSGCMARPAPPPVADPAGDQVVEAPAESPSTSPVAAPANGTGGRSQMTIGIDTMAAGFNPHVAADDSALTQSLADLVLPSAFIGGELNTTLLVSAEVIAPAPGAAQTVRYVIAEAAQWSDGTPITGADFHYLWENMVTSPGVIEAAGYRAITAVRVLNQGKTVEVDFSQPVASWRDLFSDLLPSHIVNGGGASFAQVLAETIPASAGKFMVRSVDRARGVITLNRNDRYWGPEPATVDIVNLQEVRGSEASLVRAGQVAFVDMAPSETTLAQVALLPGVETAFVDREVALTVVFNQQSPVLATPQLRADVARILDGGVISRIAFGRSTDVAFLPPPTFTPQTLPAPTGTETAEPVVRVAADPRNAIAQAAAQAIVDTINLARPNGMTATLVGEMAAGGNADMFVQWWRPDDVSGYQCDSTANVTGFCDLQVDATISSVLAGQLDVATATQVLAQVNARDVITYPLAKDRRRLIVPDPAVSGVVGPKPEAGALTTAASWQLQ